jgi:homoserine O-acetyltransferase
LVILCAATPLAAQEQQFADLGTCELESGAQLEECRVGYITIGELNDARDNAILIPSWYGGSSSNWVELQAELLGDDHDYFVVAIDALANGVSISPSNSSAQPGDEFPEITTRDMVRSQYRLATEMLGLDGVHAVMGISMGGMQTFEWSVRYWDFMQKLIPIAGSPELNGHDVALWEAYKRLFRWAAECECAEASETMAALGALNSTTSDQAQARVAGDVIKAQIEETFTDPLPLGRAIDLIRQADAMMATGAAAADVQAEMLVIVGSSDHVVTPGPAIEFAEHLGDKATLIVFQNDCGHNIPGCEMFRARSLVREFLRQD